MSEKIAVFYIIAQVGDWWKEKFYIEQLERLKSSGLYDQIEFIDIMVGGDNYEPLPFILDKTRDIMYLRPKRKNVIKFHKHIWNFCKQNPDYKIFLFNALGVSYHEIDNPFAANKLNFKEYLESIDIDHWEKCVKLLDHYDVVGTEYHPEAVFYPPDQDEIRFESPHFVGGFWWANSSYIASLDIEYLDQDVIWTDYITELWVGSKFPKAYCFWLSWQNHYLHHITPPLEDILNQADNHIKELEL